MLLRPPPPALAPEAMAAASCYRWVRSARHLPIVPSRPAIHRLAGRLNRRLRCDKASSSLTVRTCNWSLPVVIHVSCSRLPVVQLLDFVGNALPGAVPGIALAHPSPSGLQLARLWNSPKVWNRVPLPNRSNGQLLSGTYSYARANSTRGCLLCTPIARLCYAIPPSVMLAICLKKCLNNNNVERDKGYEPTIVSVVPLLD
jgi:hypothetical protein